MKKDYFFGALLKILFTMPFIAIAQEPALQITLIPDANFEQALISLGHDDVLDGKVLTANINTLTTLEVYNKDITDLTGIEDFTALTLLNCAFNSITSLDVSSNTSLTHLFCYINDITSLSLGNTTILEEIKCYSNKITSIDVSKNTGLKVLECYDNSISTIDVSKNLSLIELNCGKNNISAINVSLNTYLRELYVSDNNFNTIDVSKNTHLTQLGVSDNNLNTIDVSLNTKLQRFYCSGNNLTTIDVSKNTVLNRFSCGDNNLTSLDLSKLTSIASLSYNGNTGLVDVDLTNNTQLAHLYCYNTGATSLDLSDKPKLNLLNCAETNITRLDLSLNSKLTILDCSGNNLTSLNVKNGNNSNVTIFDALDNPYLTCIEVDDPDFSSASSKWEVDETTGFSEDCDVFLGLEDEELALLTSVYIADKTLVINNLEAGRTTVILYNMQGQQVFKTTIDALQSNKIALPNLNKGVYVVSIRTIENRVITKKILVF